LGSSGLVITGGPSVTITGINAGNRVITSVAAGTASDHAVNLGQLDVVGGVAAAAQSAAAQNTNDIATNAAAIDAVRQVADSGWDLSAEGGPAANVAPGGSVDFSSDANIEVSRTGTNLTFSLADEIEVQSISAGSAAFGSNGLTIDGG